MDAEKEKLLFDTYKKFLESLFQETVNYDILDTFICKEVIGFGTAIDEKVDSLLEYKKMLRIQHDQINGMEINTKFIPFKRAISPTNNSAVFADDIYLTFVVEKEKLEIYIRLSTVLEYRSEKWVIITFHGSKPEYVDKDVDTFGIESWKQKNIELERIVAEKTAELNAKLEELKATQAQLIQSEKMASLGELTAGIAHEIQNPLNFVNNFAEVSNELIDEIVEERTKEKGNRNVKLEDQILNDLKQNLQKINHHGKRAESIVKSMLLHSRKSSDSKEPVDINALCDEYLRLSYHGLRAKDKTFNATLLTEFDENMGEVHALSQDLGRVILNLLTNAFYAVNDKIQQNREGYNPTVTITTKRFKHKVLISVIDNGDGIAPEFINKIFQPFFTTKPTGQGTGLGLSMSYDIITKGHAGSLEVETNKGIGSKFTITLPI